MLNYLDMSSGKIFLYFEQNVNRLFLFHLILFICIFTVIIIIIIIIIIIQLLLLLLLQASDTFS